MINIKKYRDEFILHPTVPTGTETIEYQVRVNSTVVYAGQTRWFGDEYTVDLKDWIDSYITKEEAAGRQVYQVTVVVDFIYTDEDNISRGQSIQYTWEPRVLDLVMPVQSQTCPVMYIELSNCGFVHYDQQTSKVKIPLMCKKGRLICSSRNKLIKTTYMDKYGDTHNGSMDNRYELDVYVDPDWMGVHKSDGIGSYNYECVMLALQNALSASMKCEYFITMPGFFSSSTTDMPGRVKDIESVDVRTYYNADHKVPTLKITFEIYK